MAYIQSKAERERKLVDQAAGMWKPPVTGKVYEKDGREYVLVHAGAQCALFRVYKNGKMRKLQRWPYIWKDHNGNPSKYGPGMMCGPDGCYHAGGL